LVKLISNVIVFGANRITIGLTLAIAILSIMYVITIVAFKIFPPTLSDYFPLMLVGIFIGIIVSIIMNYVQHSTKKSQLILEMSDIKKISAIQDFSLNQNKPISTQLSSKDLQFVLTKIIENKKKYKDNELEYNAQLYDLLLQHFQLRYGICTNSGNKTEDFATLVRKLLKHPDFSNEPESSSEKKCIDIILSRKDITPAKIVIGSDLKAILSFEYV